MPLTGVRAKIGRHDAGGPAVEGERRRQHAPVAERYQILLPRRIGGAKNVDRICSVRKTPPFVMVSARHTVAQLFPMGPAVCGCNRRQMHRRLCIRDGQCAHPIGPHKVSDERSRSVKNAPSANFSAM